MDRLVRVMRAFLYIEIYRVVYNHIYMFLQYAFVAGLKDL